MDDRLQVLASAQFGSFSAGDAAQVGVGSSEITRYVRRGEVRRIRRGAYVLARTYAGADLSGQRRLRVMAVLRTRPGDRASHHSALTLLGIGSYGVDERMVEVESRSVNRRRVSGGLATNPWTGGDTWSWEKYEMVAPARACVQVVATGGFIAALCAMDSAMFLGRCTAEEIRAAAESLPPIHRTIALRALEASDPKAEAVGETRTRVILRDGGFTVESQVVMHAGSTVAGRVDFLVDGCVIVEFDGLVKYQGNDGKAALAAEKHREDELTSLGYEVVRLTWADLKDPEAVIRAVRAARRTATARRRAMGLATT